MPAAPPAVGREMGKEKGGERRGVERHPGRRGKGGPGGKGKRGPGEKGRGRTTMYTAQDMPAQRLGYGLSSASPRCSSWRRRATSWFRAVVRWACRRFASALFA